MISPPGFVAQSGAGSLDVSGILLALGLLVIAVMIGGGVILLVRRWVKSEGEGVEEGFGLQELRDLHAAGDLSDEEFERARAAVIEKVKASVSEDVPESETDDDETV
jgi:hypothetical protein